MTASSFLDAQRACGGTRAANTLSASSCGSLARALLVVVAASNVARVSAVNTGREIRLASRPISQDASSLSAEPRHADASSAADAAHGSAVSWSQNPQVESRDSASPEGGLDSKTVAQSGAHLLGASDASTSGLSNTSAEDLPNLQGGQPDWLGDQSGESSQRIPEMWKEALEEAKVSSEQVAGAITAHGKAVRNVFAPAARMVGATKQLHKAELESWLADEKTRLVPFETTRLVNEAALESEQRDAGVGLQDEKDVADENSKVREEAERSANASRVFDTFTDADVQAEQARLAESHSSGGRSK